MEESRKLIGYRVKEINDVIDFVNECCTQDVNVITKTKDLYDSYVTWCENSQNQYMVKKLGLIVILEEQLKRNGISITSVRKNSYRGWKGISLEGTGESLNLMEYTPTDHTPKITSYAQNKRPKKLLMTKDVAERLSVTFDQAKEWILSGEIPSVKLDKMVYRVREKDLNKWIEELQVKERK